MKFAIADPPYLGRAERWYGAAGRGHFKDEGTRADVHDDASEWDDPARHALLVGELILGYDGWAIAMTSALASIRVYAEAAPPGAFFGSWARTNAMPDGSRITKAWEPVLFYVPPTLRGRDAAPHASDVLVEGVNVKAGFLGHKPAKWTRWVLGVLGYDPGRDELHDLFPGSGAVSAAADGLLPAWRDQ